MRYFTNNTNTHIIALPLPVLVVDDEDGAELLVLQI